MAMRHAQSEGPRTRPRARRTEPVPRSGLLMMEENTLLQVVDYLPAKDANSLAWCCKMLQKLLGMPHANFGSKTTRWLFHSRRNRCKRTALNLFYARLSHVRCLSMSRDAPLPELLGRFTFTRLHTLQLGYGGGRGVNAVKGHEVVTALARAMESRHLPALRTLDMYMIDLESLFSGRNRRRIMSSSLGRVEKLRLRSCRLNGSTHSASHHCGRELAEWLRTLSALRVLDLGENPLDDEGFAQALHDLPPSIRVLDVSRGGQWWWAERTGRWVEELVGLQLEELLLEGHIIGDPEPLRRFLSGCSSLHTLSLARVEGDIVRMVEVTKVRFLCLMNARIRVSHAVALMRAFRASGGSLLALDLRHNRIKESEGAEDIASVIPPNLEILDLAGNRVGDGFVAAMEDHLSKSSLRIINLAGNAIGEAAKTDYYRD